MGVATAAQVAADDPEEVNKAAVRAWFDAINAQDLDGLLLAVDKYYAPDYVLHDPTVPNFSGGAETLKLLVRESMEALPDAHLTIEHLIAEGDMVAVHASVTGTQPDGQPLSFSTIGVIRFVDGQFAEEWQLAGADGAEVVGSDIGQE
jgi:ketosteroid isomerase-like protein